MNVWLSLPDDEYIERLHPPKKSEDSQDEHKHKRDLKRKRKLYKNRVKPATDSDATLTEGSVRSDSICVMPPHWSDLSGRHYKLFTSYLHTCRDLSEESSSPKHPSKPSSVSYAKAYEDELHRLIAEDEKEKSDSEDDTPRPSAASQPVLNARSALNQIFCKFCLQVNWSSVITECGLHQWQLLDSSTP